MTKLNYYEFPNNGLTNVSKDLTSLAWKNVDRASHARATFHGPTLQEQSWKAGVHDNDNDNDNERCLERD